MSRFMTWKLATSFVLTTDTCFGPEEKHGGEEAILAVASHVASASGWSRGSANGTQ